VKKVRLYRSKKLALWLFLKDAYAYWRLKSDKQFWSYLFPVFENSKSSGCDYSELLLILNHVRRARPKTILELGSGVSTVVIAYAIKSLAADGYSCRFISLEEEESYHNQLKGIFPPELIGLVELHNSPAVDRPIPGGYTARCYRDKPRLAYDFVFIDGPQVPKTGGYFDGDILDAIEWNPKPFKAFLDQRIATRNILRKIIPFAKMRGSKNFTKLYIPAENKRQRGRFVS
jgi:hypothetical protein